MLTAGAALQTALSTSTMACAWQGQDIGKTSPAGAAATASAQRTEVRVTSAAGSRQTYVEGVRLVLELAQMLELEPQHDGAIRLQVECLLLMKVSV